MAAHSGSVSFRVFWTALRARPLKFCRRIKAAAVGALCAAAFFHPAYTYAQTFPGKPIKMVVTAGPGGPIDILARIVAGQMAGVLGQNVIVENIRAVEGIQRVLRAAPDGYELLVFSDQVAADQKSIAGDVNFTRDFASVAFMGAAYYALVVRPESGYKNLSDFRNGEKYKKPAIGMSAGARNKAVLNGLSRSIGVEPIEVPFRNTPQLMTDLAGGNLTAAIVALPDIVPALKNGKIRVLAMFGSRKMPGFDLPTAIEQGVQFVSFNGYGILAPAGTPANVISRLEDAIAKSLSDQSLKGRLRELGIDAYFGTGRAYRAYLTAGLGAEGKGGAGPSLDNCSKCTSDSCTNPSEECKVCCQPP